MPNFEGALLEYQDKLQGLHADLAQADAKQSAAVALLLVGLAAFLALCFAAYGSRRATPAWLPPVLLPMAVLPWRRFLQSRRAIGKVSRLRRFYQSGVDRLTGEWAGKGASGEEFSRAEHLYERDLNIFGAGSLFELLCTTRSQVGQLRLASYLLDLPGREETRERQDAVKELQPRSDLREQMCLLGEYSFQGCDWEPFREWLDSPPVTAARGLPWTMPVISCALVLMVLIPWLAPPGAGLWTLVAPYLFALAAVQIGLAVTLRGRVVPVLDRSRNIGHEITLFWEGLKLLEAQAFRSAKLKGLADRVMGAGGAVRTLDRLIQALDQCNKDWFYGPSRALLVDTQLALAIERWKARHGEDLRNWLDGWAEFEALNALACYAHEHPEDVFPEMPDGASAFEAAGLGHPLLPESACVRNDVVLNQVHKIYLVSGSNMAGKSTLLRSIGINAVLGSAGAPVRAHRARQSSFTVCASISIVDSLGEGKSKFMAEVDRLRETLRAATDGPKPVLFMIDEILSGTNSLDRRVAVESFLRALIGAGAIGAVSTHDLSLTEIAEEPELGGSNVHMESREPSDPFAFDYLLKPGVSTHSNGLAIARMAGVASPALPAES
jgi:MutS domain V